MSEKSTNNTIAAFTSVTPARLNHRKLLLFALPLTLAMGCASGSHHGATAHRFNETPVPIVPPTYEQQATDMTIRDGIHALFLADRSSAFDRSAAVKDGVVTLRGPVPGGSERKRIDDAIRALPGVKQLIDDRGGVALAVPEKFGP